MSYIKLPEKDDLSGEALEVYEDTVKRWGYVPNISRAYLMAPEIMRAEDVWTKGVMHKGFLSRRLKEAIATAVSSTNECNYCASSHAHAYKIAGGSEEDARALKKLQFNVFAEGERVALEFAAKATQDANSIHQEDIDALRGFYTDAEVVEICVVIQQFMGYNWFVTMLGLELETENSMGDV